MSNNPSLLVSIIIPCRNAEQWVAEAIQSCLNQTYQNLEIIFVDDGSTDRSVEIVKAFQSQKIKIIQQEKRGVNAARNVGFYASRGSHVCFFDADDLLSPDKIEEEVNLAVQFPDAVITCNTICFHDGDPISQGWEAYQEQLRGFEGTGLELFVLARLKHRFFPQTATWLISRKIVQQAGLWDEDIRIATDFEFSVRFLAQTAQIKVSKRGCVYYRLSTTGKNIWNFTSIKKIEDYEHCLKKIEKNLMALGFTDELKLILANEYIEYCFEIFPKYWKLTNRLMKKVESLGGATLCPRTSPNSPFRFLMKLIGWRATRLLQIGYNSIKNILKLRAQYFF